MTRSDRQEAAHRILRDMPIQPLLDQQAHLCAPQRPPGIGQSGDCGGPDRSHRQAQRWPRGQGTVIHALQQGPKRSSRGFNPRSDLRVRTCSSQLHRRARRGSAGQLRRRATGRGSAVCRLRLAQHIVGANAAPDHMRLASDDLSAVFKRRPSVGRERDLPHASRTLNAMNTQRRRESRRVQPQGCDERRQHLEERTLQLAWQPTKLAIETSKPLECRHLYADGSTGRSSSLAAIRWRCSANSSSRKTRPSVSRTMSDRRSCSGRRTRDPSPRRSTSSYAPATPGSRNLIFIGVGATTKLWHAERLQPWQQFGNSHIVRCVRCVGKTPRFGRTGSHGTHLRGLCPVQVRVWATRWRFESSHPHRPKRLETVGAWSLCFQLGDGARGGAGPSRLDSGNGARGAHAIACRHVLGMARRFLRGVERDL